MVEAANPVAARKPRRSAGGAAPHASSFVPDRHDSDSSVAAPRRGTNREYGEATAEQVQQVCQIKAALESTARGRVESLSTGMGAGCNRRGGAAK